MRKIIKGIIILLTGMSLCGCTSTDRNSEVTKPKSIEKQVETTVEEPMKEENKELEEAYILLVKNSMPEGNFGKNFEEAFTEFFSDSTWEYCREDEKQDHYTENGNAADEAEKDYIVDFNGTCEYKGIKGNVKLRFILDRETGKAKPKDFFFNDVEQSEKAMEELLETIFKDEKAEEEEEEKGKKLAKEELEEKEKTTDLAKKFIDDYLDYAGEYLTAKGASLEFNMYTSIEDMIIGNACIMDERQTGVMTGQIFELKNGLLCMDEVEYNFSLYEEDGERKVDVWYPTGEFWDTFVMVKHFVS